MKQILTSKYSRWFFAIILLIGCLWHTARANQLASHSICVDPFCTYAPPKLTGQGMAEAAKGIIAAGQIKTTSYPTAKTIARTFSGIGLFLHSNLHFIDPDFIATDASDPRLKRLLDDRCLYRLTHTPQDPPLADSTGPFFVYRFDGKNGAKDHEYLAVAVFGRGLSEKVRDKSYGQRVEEESSEGIIWFLDRWPQCHFLTEAGLGTRSAKIGNPPFKPRLAGFAYDEKNGKVIIYHMVSVSGGKGVTDYLFELMVRHLPDGKITWSSDASINGLPADFDPTFIIDKQERIP